MIDNSISITIGGIEVKPGCGHWALLERRHRRPHEAIAAAAAVLHAAVQRVLTLERRRDQRSSAGWWQLKTRSEI